MSDVSIHFVFDLEHKHNVFTLYLGGIFVGLFMIIFIIALTHRRKHVSCLSAAFVIDAFDLEKEDIGSRKYN